MAAAEKKQRRKKKRVRFQKQRQYQRQSTKVVINNILSSLPRIKTKRSSDGKKKYLVIGKRRSQIKNNITADQITKLLKSTVANIARIVRHTSPNTSQQAIQQVNIGSTLLPTLRASHPEIFTSGITERGGIRSGERIPGSVLQTFTEPTLVPTPPPLPPLAAPRVGIRKAKLARVLNEAKELAYVVDQPLQQQVRTRAVAETSGFKRKSTAAANEYELSVAALERQIAEEPHIIRAKAAAAAAAAAGKSHLASDKKPVSERIFGVLESVLGGTLDAIAYLANHTAAEVRSAVKTYQERSLETEPPPADEPEKFTVYHQTAEEKAEGLRLQKEEKDAERAAARERQQQKQTTASELTQSRLEGRAPTAEERAADVEEEEREFRQSQQEHAREIAASQKQPTAREIFLAQQNLIAKMPEKDPNQGALGSSSATGVGLYDNQIENLMARMPYFDGVFSLDTFMKFSPAKKHFSAIVNTERYPKPGHWVAVAFNLPHEGQIYYYDSLGHEPGRFMGAAISRIAKRMKMRTAGPYQLKINRVKSQKNTTDSCGWHAMQFLKKVVIDREPWGQATGFNDLAAKIAKVKKSHTEVSEKAVERFEKKFVPFKENYGI